MAKAAKSRVPVEKDHKEAAAGMDASSKRAERASANAMITRLVDGHRSLDVLLLLTLLAMLIATVSFDSCL